VLSLIAAKQWEKLRAVWYSERNIALLLNLKTSIATIGAGTATLPEHLSSPPVLVGFVLLDLKFYVYVL
jgi:hypothetical protein